MKIAYFARVDIEKGSGVLKKISRQARYWQQAGHEVRIFCLTRPVEEVWHGLSDLSIEYFQTKNYLALLQKSVRAQKAIRMWKPDLIYWRYSSYYPGLVKLIKRFPTIAEINSNYNKEYKHIHNPFGYLFHLMTYKRSFTFVKGFITLTQDIANWVRGHDHPTLVCGDSINLREVEVSPAPRNVHPNLILLASAGFPWIAIDKVLKLADHFQDWQFHIVGLTQIETTTNKERGNVHFHGFLDAISYREIIRNSDIAIGTLGLHRIEMNQMAPLKLREYLAYGLPTIIAYEDTDFIHGAPFILQLPNTEGNIEENLGKIEEFVLKNMGSRVNREKIQHLDIEIKEEKKLAFFSKIHKSTLRLPTVPKVIIVRSNPVDPDPRVEKTAHALASHGFSTHILCWDRDGNSSPLERKNGITIVRKYISAKYGRGIYNLHSYILWQIKELLYLIKNRDKYDLVHACDFDTAIPAYLATRLFSSKFLVYDLFDFYSDHIRYTPEWIKKTIRVAEISIIDKADGVIITDECRIDQISGSNPKHLTIINNTPPEFNSITTEIKTSSTNRMYSRENRMRIVYVGMLLKERGLFSLLDIIEKRPEWVLELGGFGGDELAIKSRAKELANVNFHGKISYQHSLQLGANADLFFALYDPDIPNHKYASPNKLFEAMMLCKPVLVAKNTHIDNLVHEFQCGMIVEYDNQFEIEEAIDYLAQNPKEAAEMGKNARKAYDTKYSWKIMENRLVTLYSKILDIKS